VVSHIEEGKEKKVSKIEFLEMPPRDDILLVTTTRKFCAPQFLG
jgi:hypothetical protein